MKQNKPLIIGLTGGIGSGKSSVLAYIAANYPVTVIYADEVGRELMEKGQRVYKALVAYYGDGILLPDGAIDRKGLAALAMASAGGFDKLNEIEHPLIREEILARVKMAETPVVFIEAALLKEGKLTEDCDEIWAVFAPKKVRILRLMASRGYTRKQAESYMKNQMTYQEFRRLSTRLIRNDGTMQEMMAEADRAMAAVGISKK